MSKILIKESSPGNRGVFASQQIKSQETILSIPIERIITAEKVLEQSETAKKLVENEVYK